MLMLTMSHHLCHLFSLSLLVLVYSTLQQATPPLSYHVTEEQARGTLVANLSADARLSPEVLSKVRFRFLSDSQPLFVIDGSSGVIRTGEVIDRDHASLCRYQVTCIIELDVALQPLQYFQVSLHCSCRYIGHAEPCLFHGHHCRRGNLFSRYLTRATEIRRTVKPRLHDTTGSQTRLTTGLTTGCYHVNGV